MFQKSLGSGNEILGLWMPAQNQRSTRHCMLLRHSKQPRARELNRIETEVVSVPIPAPMIFHECSGVWRQVQQRKKVCSELGGQCNTTGSSRKYTLLLLRAQSHHLCKEIASLRILASRSSRVMHAWRACACACVCVAIVLNTSCMSR